LEGDEFGPFQSPIITLASKNSIAGLVTRIQAGRLINYVSIPIMGMRIFSSIQTYYRTHPIFLFIGKLRPFPQGAGHDTDHSLPSSTELRMKELYL
jgi:hypothetical protein